MLGCWFGAVVCWSLLFLVNPVTGTLSLLWLCCDSKDCHCRHDERSNRSKKEKFSSNESKPVDFCAVVFPLELEGIQEQTLGFRRLVQAGCAA